MPEAQVSPPFIRSLANLEPGRQRAALAALRESLREGRALEAAPYVLPFGVPPAAEHAAFLVAGLFALHPIEGNSSLATALRLVRDKTKSESIEQRFRALLSASSDDLPTHLRHAVALVASHGLGLDWADLFRAVRDWDFDGTGSERRSKRQWARDFWADATGAAISNET